MEEQIAEQVADRDAKRAIFHAQFNLLMETIMDELIPGHWRCLCLDYVYRPLYQLQALCDDESSRQVVRRLKWELSTCARYVKCGLTH